MLLSGCYFGAGPSVGFSIKHRQLVVGWEGAVIGVAGVSGGQLFRRDERWRATSWGALDVEWAFLTKHGNHFVPLLRGQVGGAEGETDGFVAGVGAGALAFPNGVCSTDYSLDLTLSVRRVAGDTQLTMTTRAAYYPVVPGCASP